MVLLELFSLALAMPGLCPDANPVLCVASGWGVHGYVGITEFGRL
jgi:hypothetical protein